MTAHTRLAWTPPARTTCQSSGPLVILTHGWGGSPHEWHRITAHVRTLGVRVAHVDHQGWRPTPRRAVLSLLGICARLRDPQSPLLLLGHSLGAGIALAASQHCRPDAVLALAPTRILPGSTRAARQLGARLEVAVGAADMLTGPTGDAAHLARAAGSEVRVLDGVTHAGFLVPEPDVLARQLRALEARAAARRGRAADPPHVQQASVTALLDAWVRTACSLPESAGRAQLDRDGVRA